MADIIRLSENNWTFLISKISNLEKLMPLFKFSIKIHTNYLSEAHVCFGYPNRTYTLEFQNEKSYTHFILKYGDLIGTSLD